MMEEEKKIKEVIIYNDFMKSVNVSNCVESENTLLDAHIYLSEGKLDCVSYNVQKDLILNNIAVFEIDKNGDYIYEYKLERHVDIIDNFNIFSDNVKMKFVINGIEYDKINEFVCMCAPYSELKLKLIFNDASKCDKISLVYTNYLLSYKNRDRMIKGQIITDTCIYSEGTCRQNELVINEYKNLKIRDGTNEKLL